MNYNGAENNSLLIESEEDKFVSLPLDVQIAEIEEENDPLEEIPVKTELAENSNDSDSLVVEQNNKFDLVKSEEDENVLHCTIKAEPLEENYVDKMNDFLQDTTKTSEYNQGIEISTNGESDTANGPLKDGEENEHLPKPRRKTKRKRQCNFKCGECSATFKYKSTYDYHLNSECGSKMIGEHNQLMRKGKDQAFLCNICNKSLCSRTSLMVHMRIHNGERPFSCNICSRSFFQKAHLKDHMKYHEDKPVKPLFTCSECGDLFSEKKLLRSHMEVHFGDKQFDCNVCHKRFKTKSNLNNHKIVHMDLKGLSCSVCGKEFARRTSLANHMRIHTQEKPFACEICGKAFAEKTRCNTHVKRHTGELKQVCSFCGMKFASSYDLRVHKRKHTGEKPFACNICGRMFNRKAIMDTHMTIHTGKKDFVCVQCGEAFNRKSKLDIHLTSHTGERFFCEICHRVFKCKAYLVPHLRTHQSSGYQSSKLRRLAPRPQGMKPRPHCIICLKLFTSAGLLQNHLAEKHPVLVKPRIPGHNGHTHDDSHWQEGHQSSKLRRLAPRPQGMKPRPHCIICLKLFTSPGLLQNHIAEKHPVLVKPTCSVPDFEEVVCKEEPVCLSDYEDDKSSVAVDSVNNKADSINHTNIHINEKYNILIGKCGQ